MPRVIKNKKAVALATKGNATYKNGKKPEIIKTDTDILEGMINALALVTKQINELPVPDSNAEVIESCQAIMENLNTYQVAMERNINGININPVVDMSMLNEINTRLEAIIQISMQRENREWVFHVERDEQYRIQKVIAKETIH